MNDCPKCQQHSQDQSALAAMKAEHERFCEDAQQKTDKDFAIVRNEIEKLKEEIKCRIQSYDHLDDFNIKLNDEIEKLKEENERLRRCLK